MCVPAVACVPSVVGFPVVANIPTVVESLLVLASLLFLESSLVLASLLFAGVSVVAGTLTAGVLVTAVGLKLLDIVGKLILTFLVLACCVRETESRLIYDALPSYTVLCCIDPKNVDSRIVMLRKS